MTSCCHASNSMRGTQRRIAWRRCARIHRNRTTWHCDKSRHSSLARFAAPLRTSGCADLTSERIQTARFERGADKLGLLILEKNCPFRPPPVVGACTFVRHDPASENWARDVRYNRRDKAPFWEFVWVWVHPYARRAGRTRSALKYFSETYGRYRVYRPVTKAGAALCRTEKVRVLRQATRGERR